MGESVAMFPNPKSFTSFDCARLLQPLKSVVFFVADEMGDPASKGLDPKLSLEACAVRRSSCQSVPTIADLLLQRNETIVL